MDKEGQHIMIHGSLYKKITILNMYALNYRAPKYMSECDRTIRSTKESVITVGAINTSISEMDRSNGQKICINIVELNSTINQLDMIDICCLHQSKAEHTFFAGSHGTSTKKDHIWATKHTLANLREFKSYNVCFLTTIELNWNQ